MTAQFAAITIDSSVLTSLVRKALGTPAIDVADWSVQQLHVSVGQNLGIYRLSGMATEGNVSTPWSIILKGLAPPLDHADPGDCNYWKREVMVYQSGFLDGLPGTLNAPRCYAVEERRDGSVWLWLEDVALGALDAWSLDDYGGAAYELGRLNGAYLSGMSLLTGEWASRNWLRGWVEDAAPSITLLRESLDHPLVRRVCPPQVASVVFQVWAERDFYFRALTRLPQTFCHLDAFRRNLLLRPGSDGGRETYMIDWAFSGQGTVGEELVALCIVSVMFMEVPASSALALEEVAFAGYLDGLREAGWRGDPRQVLLGYTVAGLLRFSLGVWKHLLPALLDERRHSRAERLFRRPFSENMEHRVQLGNLYAVRLARQVRDLIEELSLS